METAARHIPTSVHIRRNLYAIRLSEEQAERLQRKGSRARLYPGKVARTFYVTKTTLDILTHLKKRFELVREFPPDKTGIEVIFPLRTVLHSLPDEAVREEILAQALARRSRGEACFPVYHGRTQDELPGTFVFDRPGGSRTYRWSWERSRPRRRELSFQERFPKLIGLMTDPETRFVVSLGSGGLRMFAHPSIFNLIEAMGTQDSIEEIWGASGGAIAGLAYSLGAEHEIMEREGYNIYHREYDLKLGPSAPEVFKNLILRRLLPGTAVSLKGFVDIQNAMQASLTRVVKHQKPKIPFFAVAYNMDEHQNEVLTTEEVDAKRYGDLFRHTSAINAVLASAALPILFVPRIIKRGRRRVTYIDGGIFEEVPLMSVFHKWKVDRKYHLTKKKRLFIIAVNLFPFLSTWRFFGTVFTKYVPVLELVGFLSRLADLARRARIDDQIRSINQDANAKVVEITLPRLSKFNFLDPQIIPIVIDKAHGTFFDQLADIEDSLPAK